MNRYRRIHVGLELDRKEDVVTPGSQQAARQATWLAKQTGARVSFFHSTWDDRVGEGGELSSEDHATLQDLVDEHAEELETKCDLSISAERAWLFISREVSRTEEELVVVGKRDQERDKGRRLGSVAMKLMRKCPAAIWAVRPEHDLVHKLVLGATDLTPVGREAADLAGWITRNSKDCQLHLVHALRISNELRRADPPLSEDEYSKALDELRAKALEAICEGLTEPEPEPKVHIGRGAPAQVIREAVQHLGPDLLVMGTLSKGGVAGMLTGSTAERLLQRVDCSLLAVKPHDFVSPIAAS